uniref:Glucose-6-phosphate 1-epimerase n=1 Tax=Blastobotrys adeninivorans TaxID=409370 RepID=A0A060TCF2_BLAAD
MGVKETESEVTLSFKESEVRVLKFGATVLSWKVKGQEQLWLSDKAILDGSKAVRGGIPLVFPVFGKATEGPCAKLPQHGFARNHSWELLGQVQESPLKVQFALSPDQLSQEARDQWPSDFTLIYTLTLDSDSLTTEMSVENPGQSAFGFNVLFHTYFRIPSVDSVKVNGLGKVPVHDKVSVSKYQADGEPVTISSEVDRVYSEIADSNKIEILNGDKVDVDIERTNLPDVVVWNPWIEKANGLGDFYPKDGYKTMICVETGSVSSPVNLEPGSSWVGRQVLKAHL